MNCIICGTAHEKKGIYCSKKCTDKAYRDRKKGLIQAAKSKNDETISREKKALVKEEKGVKNRWCNYCGTSLEETKMLQFCSDAHHKAFDDAVATNKYLQIKIDDRTTVVTKKYHKVQEIIEKRQTPSVVLRFF
jgi:predicted nucleic acid-binding Zn ribbon protein